MTIIDSHTHIFPPFCVKERERLFKGEQAFESIYGSPGSKMIEAETLIQSMDEQGIDRSVVFGFPWEDPGNFKRHNDYIIDSVNRYPDRLTGLSCFSPFYQESAAEAERCLEAGLSGVGELAVYGSGLSSRFLDSMKDLMSLCECMDVPLLLHTNEPVGHSYPGKAPMTLSQIYRFVKAFPKNRIVLAHWGGGIFFYCLMKKEVPEVMKNVWLDTAASPFLYSPEIYLRAAEIIGPEKILFGSDFPLIRPKRYLDEMESCGLEKTALKKITGANAALLFGLESD